MTVPAPTTASAGRSWWMYTPVIGIGAAAIACAILMIVGFRVRPEAVEAHPYQASYAFDAEKAATQRFAALGGHLTARVDGAAVEMSSALGSGALHDATLTFYRPDRSDADFAVRWDDASQPLRVTLPLRGRWQVRLDATAAGGAVRAEIGCEQP
jgi:nitrogen fixation protein FixH